MSAIDDLASEFAKLPGIGRKTALRLTYHLLKRPPEQGRRLASALLTVAEHVRTYSPSTRGQMSEADRRLQFRNYL